MAQMVLEALGGSQIAVLPGGQVNVLFENEGQGSFASTEAVSRGGDVIIFTYLCQLLVFLVQFPW